MSSPDDGFKKPTLSPNKSPRKVNVMQSDDGSKNGAVSSHMSPLQPIMDFLQCLTNKELDGRIVVDSQDKNVALKYILFNPADCFSPLVAQARSIILAGGTMSPLRDFADQVF